MEQIMIFGYVQYVTSVCIYKRHGNYKSYPAPGFIVHLLMKNSFKHSNILQPPCSSEGLSLKYLREIGPTSFILESLLPHFGFSAPPPHPTADTYCTLEDHGKTNFYYYNASILMSL